MVLLKRVIWVKVLLEVLFYRLVVKMAHLRSGGKGGWETEKTADLTPHPKE